MNPKIGIVDVGGGYRSVYAAGVLDYCMHKGINKKKQQTGIFQSAVFVYVSYSSHFGSSEILLPKPKWHFAFCSGPARFPLQIS